MPNLLLTELMGSSLENLRFLTEPNDFLSLQDGGATSAEKKHLKNQRNTFMTFSSLLLQRQRKQSSLLRTFHCTNLSSFEKKWS